VIATTGVKAASGKYNTASTGLARGTLADSYTWNYAGSSTISYTWKSGLATFTGSANVGRDGSIPFMLAPKAVSAGSLAYGGEHPGTSKLTKNLYGFMDASLRVIDSGITYYSISANSLLFVTGSILEATPVTEIATSGYRYNSAWVLPDDYSVEALGGFAYAELMLSAFRPANISTDTLVSPDSDYPLTITTKGNPQDYNTGVLFKASGASQRRFVGKQQTNRQASDRVRKHWAFQRYHTAAQFEPGDHSEWCLRPRRHRE